MQKAVRNRLLTAIIMIAALSLTTYLVMTNFRDNLVFFYSPTELVNSKSSHTKRIRVGGMVKKGSVDIISKENFHLRFVVTDFTSEVTIDYKGFLPDLFREGQGLVAEGTYDYQSKIFAARSVLAKHDENYMPPDAKKPVQEGHGKGTLSVSANLDRRK